MWPEGTLSWQTRDRRQLDLDVYPQAAGAFTLYEDDGVTRGYTRGEAAEQTFTTTREASGIAVRIGPSVGTYAGKVDSRRYRLTVHDGGVTARVSVGDAVLTRYLNKAEYDAAPTGWYFDPQRGGITDVKVPALASDAAMTVTLSSPSGPAG